MLAKNPALPCIYCVLVWDLPQQWPGREKGQEEKGLPKPEESALVGKELELRGTAMSSRSLGQFLPVDMTSSDTQLFQTIIQGYWLRDSVGRDTCHQA